MMAFHSMCLALGSWREVPAVGAGGKEGEDPEVSHETLKEKDRRVIEKRAWCKIGITFFTGLWFSEWVSPLIVDT